MASSSGPRAEFALWNLPRVSARARLSIAPPEKESGRRGPSSSQASRHICWLERRRISRKAARLITIITSAYVISYGIYSVISSCPRSQIAELVTVIGSAVVVALSFVEMSKQR